MGEVFGLEAGLELRVGLEGEADLVGEAFVQDSASLCLQQIFFWLRGPWLVYLEQY